MSATIKKNSQKLIVRPIVRIFIFYFRISCLNFINRNLECRSGYLKTKKSAMKLRSSDLMNI